MKLSPWKLKRDWKQKVISRKSTDLLQIHLVRFRKNKDVILENYNSERFGQNRKRFRSGNFTDNENVLYTWFVKARSENIPISGPILASKAEILAKKLNYENFKASNGFIERFKQRQNIVYKSASVELDCVQKWKEKLPSLINGYEPRNILKSDETGLFYKLQPNKILTFKGETCFGREKKQR